MENFIFYVKIGLQHVLDMNAYDHILFLAALAIPFTFGSTKKVIILATVFTIAHCVSLALSVYGVMTMDTYFIEMAILVSILLAALFNLLYIQSAAGNKSILLHVLVTAFFGLIHGFGFSTYFKMLMAEETHKIVPLLGFATGIEFAQILIIMCVLTLAYLAQEKFKVKPSWFIGIASALIILITLPLLVESIRS